MKKGFLLGTAAVVLSVGGFLYWVVPSSKPTTSDPGMVAAAAAGGTGAGHVAPDTFVTGVEGLPTSLQGTEVDGNLEIDAAGHLKITAGIRRLFDYFLSAVGEEPLDTLLKRIRAYLHHTLPATAAAEAERLLDSYVGYRRALEAIPQVQTGSGQMDIDAIRRQMQQVQALRSQFFTPDVIAAFFGNDDAYDRYTLERLAILQDKSLTPEQRATRLAALEQQLPAGMRDSMKVINQVQNLNALTQEWKQRGGSPAELRQIRESVVGTEATDRLEALDRENAQWDQRMNGWFAERAAILANTSLSDQDRQAQVESLRNDRFNDTERIRVKSLEIIHDRGEVVNR